VQHASRLGSPRPSGNDSSMYKISALSEPTQDEVRVRAWAEVRELLELQLAPLGRRALEALAPNSGESILDIGCGGGETALHLARSVAPNGTIVGIDLSAAVLAFARRAAKGCDRVQFIQADAQVFPFEPGSFDAAFSRFGVMFFSDTTAAFINIRRGLKPNGRLAFVCWRSLEENQLDIVPLRAASAYLPPQPAHTRSRPAHSRSPIPTACTPFWKVQASRRSRSQPMMSGLEAATSMQCWRFVRGSEPWARFFGRTPSCVPRRYPQCDPPLRPTMGLMGSGSMQRRGS
jgi:ubiquinone/menaquinone biosynthesis C-methylase UbiE